MNEENLVTEYRLNNQRSRIVSILKYGVNTSCRKQKTCVLCDWWGPSWSASWPKTVEAERAELEHIKSHLENYNEVGIS